MITTLEPPVLKPPAIPQARAGETTIVLRLRAPCAAGMPVGNAFGTTLLESILRNELLMEAVPHSELKGYGPFNVSTYLFCTSDTQHALRTLKALLERITLLNLCTLHTITPGKDLLVCHHAATDKPRADAATPDDLRLEIASAFRGLVDHLNATLEKFPGGLPLDFIDAAVTRAETAAAKNQNPPAADDGGAQAS